MNLFVGNLNQSTTATSLEHLFSEFGAIVLSKVIMDNATGSSRGFGFVEMAEKFNAYDAIDNLDGTFFEGNIISVKEAKQNNTKPGGSTYGAKFSSGKSPFKPKSNPRPRPSGNNDDRFNRL